MQRNPASNNTLWRSLVGCLVAYALIINALLSGVVGAEWAAQAAAGLLGERCPTDARAAAPDPAPAGPAAHSPHSGFFTPAAPPPVLPPHPPPAWILPPPPPPPVPSCVPRVNGGLAARARGMGKSGDEPPVKELAFCGEYSPRTTEAFAISVGPTWTHLYAPGGPTGTGASGFQNLDTTFKYRFYKDPVHELIMSVGLSIEWGGSGASGVGADKFTTYTPRFFFGKGFGDLPDTVWWARPIALTGVVGYAIPGSARTLTFDPDTGDTGIELHPQFLDAGLSR